MTIAKKLNIYIKLTPETNTVAIQLPINKIDCPKSGWSIKRIITEDNNKKLNKYFILKFFILSEVSILTVVRIKNGFNNSMGFSLKKYMSNHLFEPYTSTPIIGTKISKIKKITKRGTTILFNKKVSSADIINIIDRANKVKTRCFEKKK